MSGRARTLLATTFAAICIASSASAGSSDSLRHLLEGRANLKKGNVERALSLFARAVKEDPANDEARLELGALELQNGQFLAAERQFSKVSRGQLPAAQVAPLLGAALLAEGKFKETLDVSPCTDDTECQGNILALHAQARVALGDIAGADADAQAARQATPEGIPALFAQALVLNANGDTVGAEKLVDSLLATNPHLAQALALKADLRDQAGDLDGAIAALRLSLSSDPNDLRTRVELIMALFNSGRDDEAGTAIDAMLAQVPSASEHLEIPDSSEDPDDIAMKEDKRLAAVPPKKVMGLYLKSMQLARANKMAAALDAIRPVEFLAARGIPQAAFLLAQIHAGNNNLEQALQYAAAFNNAYPDDLAGIKLLASINYRVGAYQRVIDMLDAQHDRITDDADALTLLGSSYLAEGRLEAANRILSEAVKARPDDPMTRARLAVSLSSNKTTREEGIRQLEGLAQSNPANLPIDLALIATHFSNGDYGRAIEAATEMAKRHTTSPLPLMLRGSAEIETGDDAAARRDFAAALAKDENFVPGAIALAEMEMRIGDSDAARAPLDAILKRQPINLPALLARAEIERRAGRPEAAVPYLRAATDSHPKDPQPRLALLRLQVAQGNDSQALLTAQDLARAHPDNFSIINVAASVCVKLGSPDVGLQLFRDLESRHPNSSTVSHRLGQLMAAAGRLTDARAEYSRAVGDAPSNVPAWIDLALLERRTRGLDAAMDVVQKAQAHNPKSTVAAVLRGDVLRLNGQLPEAERSYREAHAKQPTAITASRLFHILLQRGESAQAFEAARAWLKLHPEDLRIRMEMAQEEMAVGDVRAALEEYEFVSKKNPRDGTALNNLAWAYDRLDDPRAVDVARRAFQLAPSNSNVMDTYAYLLYRKGDRKSGAELLRQAYAANPKSPEVAYHMALVLAEDHDVGQARAILKPLVDGKLSFDESEKARQLYGKLGGM